VTVERSLIDHNDGAAIQVGGGPSGAGGLDLANSTVSNNGFGIAIESGEGPGGLNRIYASTLADNVSANLSVAIDQRVQIDHTLLKYLPRRGVDCVLGGTQSLPPGTPNLQSNASLASDTSCALFGPRDQEGVDPLLDALADNGGPTATRALLAGSPAIDAGDTFCTGPASELDVDQRGDGHPRPVAATPGALPRCDVGAFEVPEPDPALAAVAVVAGLASISRRRRTHPGDTACGR
jgi:MYXO-CTERM domain-containing protein